MAFDFLEQSIYATSKYESEYPIVFKSGEGSTPGYYEVEPPPNTNKVKPGQNTPRFDAR